MPNPTRDPIERIVNGTLGLVALTAVLAIQAAYSLRDRLTALGAAVEVSRSARLYRWPDGPYGPPVGPYVPDGPYDKDPR